MKFFIALFRVSHYMVRRAVLPSLAILIVVSCAPPFLPGAPKLPLDVQAFIPADWEPLGPLQTINVDGDGDNEWLLFYRYDMGANKKDRGPIGGVIFDAALDLTTGSSILRPYKLLPEFKDGKGQGYLAERDIAEWRVYDVNGDGKNDELAIFGRGTDPTLITYLTIFRWQDDGTNRGYRVVAHYHGDGGITVEADRSGPIQRIVQKTRLNDRSMLSKKTIYTREGDAYKADEVSLDFTYQIPDTPYYPEAAVLAYYLLRNAGKTKEAEKYLVAEADRKPVQASLVVARQAAPSSDFTLPMTQEPALPLALTYNSDAIVTSQAALSSPQLQPSLGPLSYSDVTIDLVEGGGRRSHIWRVVNFRTPDCKSEACWRLLGQR